MIFTAEGLDATDWAIVNKSGSPGPDTSIGFGFPVLGMSKMSPVERTTPASKPILEFVPSKYPICALCPVTETFEIVTPCPTKTSSTKYTGLL